jgi:hypothetical protein
MRNRAECRLVMMICRYLLRVGAPARAGPSRPEHGAERAGAAERSGAALIKYGSIRHSVHYGCGGAGGRGAVVARAVGA